MPCISGCRWRTGGEGRADCKPWLDGVPGRRDDAGARVSANALMGGVSEVAFPAVLCEAVVLIAPER